MVQFWRSSNVLVPGILNNYANYLIMPVGGRLTSFWQIWQALGARPAVVDLVRNGKSSKVIAETGYC